MTQRIVVVGLGIAGKEAALAARMQAPGARITVVTQDADGFYNRIGLMGLVTGKRSEAALFTESRHWMREHRVDLVQAAVVGGDAAGRTVRLSTGETLRYDALVLATGAAPVVPPIPGLDATGARALWTLGDARALRDQVRDAQDVAVIGGGVLGLEAALDLAAAGRTVHLVERAAHLLPGTVGPEAARAVLHRVRNLGVAVHTGATAAAARPDRGAVVLDLSDGHTCAVDAVLVCAGVAPDTQVARRLGVRVDPDGIAVDDRCTTSVPGIFACGNCTAWTPQRLWTPALEQGAVAGRNAAGGDASLRRRPYALYLKSGTVPVFACGVLEGAVFQDGGDDWYRAVAVDGGRIVGAQLVGDVAGGRMLERAIAAGRTVAGIDQARTAHDVLRALEAPPAVPVGVPQAGWVCRVCGYTHEGEDAPDVCPVCGVGRDQFLAA